MAGKVIYLDEKEWFFRVLKNVKPKKLDDMTIHAFLKVIFTLLGLGIIKINELSANFNNPRPSLILNN